MADLRSCYFCGTGPGGSLDSYGVVPSTLDPSQDEQRSVVLCPDCRNKLTALLRPVVDAAASSAPSGSRGSGGLSPADDDVTGLAEATTGSETSDRSSPGDSADPGGGAGESGAAGEPAGEPADSGASTTQPADAGGSTGESTDAGASADESTADQGDSTDDQSEQAVTFDEDSESDSGLAASSGGDGSPPDSPPRDPSAEALMGDDSEAYRKVIRLLQNREFPVRRVEIEDLAANAYELSPGECSDAIDAIVRKGLLVEEEGTLMRPGD